MDIRAGPQGLFYTYFEKERQGCQQQRNDAFASCTVD